MDYISIFPSELDHSQTRRYLRLPHPRTGKPQLYLPHQGQVLEVQKIGGSRRRTCFVGDDKVDVGSFLVHCNIDPLFLVIPILALLERKQNSSNPPPFQPLSDLIAVASSLPELALPPPFSGPSEPVRQSYNPDVARLLGIKQVRRVLRACCERKVIPGALPSLSGSPVPSMSSRQTYYRPSLALAIKHLRRKAEHFAEIEQFFHFDHLVRGLGRDGLLGPEISAELARCGRLKASVEHMAQWLSEDTQNRLLSHYDFLELSKHLANRAAPMIEPSNKRSNSGDAKGIKRKAPPTSKGVEALKKVNTTSMSKLTSFFKPKEEKKA